jgi:hypothetical protein
MNCSIFGLLIQTRTWRCADATESAKRQVRGYDGYAKRGRADHGLSIPLFENMEPCMSTRGAIARLTSVLPLRWKGRYHHWDSYPDGLSREL